MVEAPELLRLSKFASCFALHFDVTHMAEKGLLGDFTVTVAEQRTLRSQREQPERKGKGWLSDISWTIS